MTSIFDGLEPLPPQGGASIFDGLGGAGAAEPKAKSLAARASQAGIQLDTEAPVGDPGFIGGVKELGRGLVRGTMAGIPKATGAAADFIAGRPDIGKELDQYGEQWLKDHPEYRESQLSQVERQDWTSLRGAAASAGENAALSVGPGLAGAAIGAGIGSVIPGPGTLAGAGVGYIAGSLASLPLFYGQQGKESYEKIKKGREADIANGVLQETPEQTELMSRIGGHASGGIEAGGEYLANRIPFGKLLKPLAGMGAAAAGQVVKSVLNPAGLAKSAAKTFGKMELAEIGTEMAQQAGEAQTEKIFGSGGEGATWKDTASVILPTAIMTLLPGAFTAGHTMMYGKSARNALTDQNADPVTRAQAAASVFEQVKVVDPQVAQAFDRYSADMIAAGRSVNIDDDQLYVDYVTPPAPPQPHVAPVTPADIASMGEPEPEGQQVARPLPPLTDAATQAESVASMGEVQPEPVLDPTAGPLQRIGAAAQVAGATPGALAARITQPTEADNALSEQVAAGMGAYPGGDEGAGRSAESGGVGQGDGLQQVAAAGQATAGGPRQAEVAPTLPTASVAPAVGPATQPQTPIQPQETSLADQAQETQPNQARQPQAPGAVPAAVVSATQKLNELQTTLRESQSRLAQLQQSQADAVAKRDGAQAQVDAMPLPEIVQDGRRFVMGDAYVTGPLTAEKQQELTARWRSNRLDEVAKAPQAWNLAFEQRNIEGLQTRIAKAQKRLESLTTQQSAPADTRTDAEVAQAVRDAGGKPVPSRTKNLAWLERNKPANTEPSATVPEQSAPGSAEATSALPETGNRQQSDAASRVVAAVRKAEAGRRVGNIAQSVEDLIAQDKIVPVNDINDAAAKMAERHNMTVDQAYEILKQGLMRESKDGTFNPSDLLTINSFEFGGRNYAIAPKVEENPVGLTLHEVGVHLRQNPQFDRAALAMINERAKAATPELRQMLETVAQRMEFAGVAGQQREAMSYTVEEAAKVGGFNGSSVIDGKFMSAMDKISPELGKLIRQVVASVRAYMAQKGIKLDLRVDDLVAIARANVISLGKEVTQRGVMQFSRGEPGTPEFNKWFAGSKVVDKDGKPLVVYHHGDFTEDDNWTPNGPMHFGTRQAAEERAFGKEKERAVDEVTAYRVKGGWHWDLAGDTTSEELGWWPFATKAEAVAHGRQQAMTWVDQNPDLDPDRMGRFTEAYLNIRNPKRVADLGGDNRKWKAAIAQAKKEGYDGLVYNNRVEDKGQDSYVAFSPDQIKSATGNVGSYGQRPVTEAEAKPLGMTAEQANAAQKEGDIRFSRGKDEADRLLNQKEEQAKAVAFEKENGILPYTHDDRVEIDLNPQFSIKREGRYGEDPVTGLPLNKNGTVTLYVPTTNAHAREILQRKVLFAQKSEDVRIHLTNESSGAAVMQNPSGIEQALEGANVLVQVDPTLLHLDQEFDSGRKDFFIPLKEGAAFLNKLRQLKLFTLNAPRTNGISADRTIADITKGVASGVAKYEAADAKARRALVKDAKALLRREHNIGTLLGENGKLQKTRIGDYGLTYQGNSVASLGLGLASAQKLNERNATSCPNAAICEALCLGETSGQNQLYGGSGQYRSGPRLSQYLKTEALVLNPEAMAIILSDEITKFKAWAAKDSGVEKMTNDAGEVESVPKQVYQPAIRLNVTSDFAPSVWEALIKAHPDVMFYDYTKLDSKPIAPNHHITYSSTGATQVVNGKTIVNPQSNWSRMVRRLKQGNNVAMAFSSRNEMPDWVVDEETGQRFQVWNGDNYDARFLDPKREDGVGMIVGLTNKDRTTAPEEAATKHNGFFIDYNSERDGDTVTIPKQTKAATVAAPASRKAAKQEESAVEAAPQFSRGKRDEPSDSEAATPQFSPTIPRMATRNVVGKEGGRPADDTPGARAARQILAAMAADSDANYALRVIPGEFSGDIAIGDILPASKRWEDGSETDDLLDGTSVVGIKAPDQKSILSALHDLGALGTNGPNGYYFGDRVALVKGEPRGYGEDAGEAIFRNAEVVGVWRKTDHGLSSIQPNESAASDSPGAQFSRAPVGLGNLTPGQKTAAAKFGVDLEPMSLKKRLQQLSSNAGLKVESGLFDAFAVLKEYGEKAYALASLTKSDSAVLESLLKYGLPQLTDAGSVKLARDDGGFIGKMQALQGEHKRFLLWVAANRAERLMKEGREHNLDATDIQELKRLNEDRMNDGQLRADVYKTALGEMDRYNKSVLDFGEKAGVIEGTHYLVLDAQGNEVGDVKSLAHAQSLAKQHNGTIETRGRAMWEEEFYVPFFRSMEDGVYKGPLKKKGLANQTGIQRLKGGAEATNDLLSNVLHNWSHLYSAALRNQSAAYTLKQGEAAGVAYKVTEAQHAKGDVFVLDNGKKQYYRVEDPFTLQAISAMAPSPLTGFAANVMAKFKHALTLGVTVSPTFRIRNLIRDSLHSVATAGISANVPANIKTGYLMLNPKSDIYQQMLAGGALMHFGDALEGNNSARMDRMINSGIKDSTVLDTQEKVRDVLQKAWDWWEGTGSKAENVNRAAAYKAEYERRLAAGVAEDEAHLYASLEARKMMDFSQQGSWAAIRFLSQVVPFFNARLVGLHRLGTQGFGPTARVLTGKGTAADKAKALRFNATLGALTIAGIGLMLAYRDDDDWKQREEWDRDNNWWFKIGDTAYRIPKPFELGAMSSLGERGLEMMMDGMTPDARKRFVNRFFAILGDNLSMNPVPQAVKPIVDLYANKDSFTGRDIETQGMERLSKGNRIGPNTSAVAQALGNDLFSPVQIDHLIQGYFGWLGSHAVMAADYAVRPVMGLPDKPARKLGDTFVFGDFVKDLPANQSRYLTEFYDQLKQTGEAYADYQQALKQGQPDKARELMEENKTDIALHKMYTGRAKALSDLNALIKRTQASDMSAEDKRARIDMLTQRKLKIAEQAFNARKSIVERQ